MSPVETLVAKPLRLPFFNSIPHPSSFVHRELLLHNPFREDLRIVSDYDFFLDLFGRTFCHSACGDSLTPTRRRLRRCSVL